jgi:hypothetical protein
LVWADPVQRQAAHGRPVEDAVMTLSIAYDRSEAGPLFELRFGQLPESGERVVHKFARGGPEAERLLHNEVATGQRLWQQFGTDYPDQLAKLVLASPQEYPPNAVLTYRGEPVWRQEGLPQEETILLLFADVLCGIDALARLGLTHGAITPETVLWEPGQGGLPGRAQLVDFGRVTAVGRPRDLSLPPMWSAPPLGDAAHPSHDVYQAALLVYTVATREPPVDAAGMRARLADGPNEFLRRLLAGTFADDPAVRPGVQQLLDRVAGFQATAPTVTGSRQPTAATGAYLTTQVPVSAPRLDFRQMVAQKRAFRERQQRPWAVARRFVRDLVDLLWYRQSSMRVRFALAGFGFAIVAVLVFLLLQLIGVGG